MPLDPQIEQMLAAMPEWPGVRGVPLDMLRQSVHDSSVNIPPAADAIVARTEDRAIAGPDGDLPVRIYWPQAEGIRPIVIYFHGGGYVMGDLDTQDMIARAFCAWSDAIVVSVDYRLAPEHRFPAGIDDGYAALNWAAAHGAEIGGDNSRLGLAGDSAGGNIATALALRARDQNGPKVKALVNIYGSANAPTNPTPSAIEFADGPILRSDDIQWFWENYLTHPEVEQNHQEASPLRAESLANLPAAFIGTAEYDPSRDDSEAFAARLADEGNEVVMKRYDGMVHGFASWVGFLPGARAVMQESSQFLRDHL
ncbi:alpha/beta hydrolase [Sphingopyxis yananensis]|uniref:alpha/beta hydrolase n=1 Tax=Sphingopyxis yananensis TaxID=2886687 RepID=UPI001D0FF480|nr:alpha/beta hydrolase [Sphingopyxis yananensis]MCC2603135.1 alpha/beta hydrolase [Sphingopyxis yananensis]